MVGKVMYPRGELTAVSSIAHKISICIPNPLTPIDKHNFHPPSKTLLFAEDGDYYRHVQIKMHTEK